MNKKKKTNTKKVKTTIRRMINRIVLRSLNCWLCNRRSFRNDRSTNCHPKLRRDLLTYVCTLFLHRIAKNIIHSQIFVIRKRSIPVARIHFIGGKGGGEVGRKNSLDRKQRTIPEQWSFMGLLKDYNKFTRKYTCKYKRKYKRTHTRTNERMTYE